MRTLLTLLLCLLCGGAVAQIKLVPRATLESVANPQTVDSELVVAQQTVDFGSVAESDRVEWQVAVRNIGTKPIAYRANTSCRCLAATGGVVRAGESGNLSLSFSGKGFPGPFNHRVLLYIADQTEPTAVIWVKGYVVADSDRRGDYPYTCGALLLRQPGVKIEGNTTERIACMNGSNRAVSVTKDSLLSSPEVVVYTEPKVLQAGEEGDLVITLRGEKREKLKLYIEGEYGPSKREIKIE